MVKQEEKDLYQLIKSGLTPANAGLKLSMNQKRLEFICEKWDNLELYEYGVSCDHGHLIAQEHLTDKAKLHIKNNLE